MEERSRRRMVLGAGAALGGAALPLAPGAAPSARATVAEARRVALLSTYVAGTERHDAPGRAARLAAGEELVLRRRPDCAYDARRVEVWTADGARLGEVPPSECQALANLMDAGLAAGARAGAVVADPERPEIGLEVWIATA